MSPVAEFAELPLETMEHGLAKPIARIRSEPDQLSRELRLRFLKSQDDLDDLDAALISTTSGKQFALVRHRHQPLPGTDIVTNERTQDVTSDLIEAIQTLGISRNDLTWIHPDVDRFRLWFSTIQKDLGAAMYLILRRHHKHQRDRRDIELFVSSASEMRRAPIRWAVIAVVAVAVAVVVALLAFQFERTRKPATAELPKQTAPIAAQNKSVAVLPFENLSSDKENASFAQGIQDEIITTLSRTSGLHVISRTSTARYSSAQENLPEIARQLRVTHLVEGSVQKAGDRMYIKVQLIRSDDEAQLWAQSYDRQLTDIFVVQSEVAKKIANSLQTTLSQQEKARADK